MDLTNEIKEIQNGKVEDVISNLRQQNTQVMKKIHIAQVIQIGNFLDILYQDKTLEKLNAINIKMHYYYEPDVGNVINFDLTKSDDSKVYISNDLPKDILDKFCKLNNILFNLQDFSSSYVNERFKEGQKFAFKIENGVGSKVKELLLSNEFLSLIKYSEMQMELSNNQETINKKHKL